MKFTEDNLAEIISTEMFVKDVKHTQYNIELETIMMGIYVVKRDYNATSLEIIGGQMLVGTKALLITFGYKIEGNIIFWEEIKQKWDTGNK